MTTTDRKATPALAGVLVLVPVVAVCVCVAQTAAAAALQPGRQRQTTVPTHDDRLLQVDKQAPGFGGMFVDPDGRLAVYLLDTARLAVTRTAIESVFGSNYVPAAGIRAIKGQYSVSQLKGWSERANRLLTVPGVTLVDMDERKNRVVIGIDSSERMEAVTRELSRSRIPRNAVLLEVIGPIKPVK